ncbi:MAG: right-handed parallel beta-helix repeat-containing protein [Planctomycetota bacterium]
MFKARSGWVLGCWALALALAASSNASAAEWWVKAGASGKGDSKDAPAGSLADVLEQVTRGDVVHVAEGEYNGKGGTGEFRIGVPDLTLAGGYSADFSARDPFKHVSLLRRKAGVKTDYTKTEGGLICVDPDAHKEARFSSCSGLIVDGFVLDGATRNVYNANDHRLAAQGSWKESLIKLAAADFYTTANIKIRNCVLLNCYNMGIEIKWLGDQNEITNCLIVNNMIAGIDARAAQSPPSAPGAPENYPETKLTIKGCTVGFNWEHDKAQMANGVLLGGKGTFTITDNVFAWCAGKSSAGVRGAKDGDAVKGNVFWMTSDAASAGGDNAAADPGFAKRMSKAWFTPFTGFAARYGKLELDGINAERKAAGLDPIEKLGQAMAPELCAWGVALEPKLEEFVTAFKADQEGKGWNPAGPFEAYKERACALPGGKPGAEGDYQAIEFTDLLRKGGKDLADGTKVKLKLTLRTRAARYGDKQHGLVGNEYLQVEVGKPGEKVAGNTTNKLFAYFVHGAQPNLVWNRFGKRGANAKTQGGVEATGTLFKTSQPANGAVPYVLVIDHLGEP